MQKLTKEQAAVIGAYTGVLCGDFASLHEYAERVLGRSIWTHQFPELREELKAASKKDFLALCYDGR